MKQIEELLREVADSIDPRAAVVVDVLPHCATWRVVLGGRRVLSVHSQGWPVTVEQHHADPSHSTTWAQHGDFHDPNNPHITHRVGRVVVDGEELEVLIPKKQTRVSSVDILRSLLTKLLASEETRTLVEVTKWLQDRMEG